MTDIERNIVEQVVGIQNGLTESFKEIQQENQALKEENQKLKAGQAVQNPMIANDIKDDEVSELMTNYLKNR